MNIVVEFIIKEISGVHDKVLFKDLYDSKGGISL